MQRTIYFDMGNVLLNFDHHRAARQMATVAGCDETLVWNVAFESGLNDRFDAGQIDEAGFWKEFCAQTGTRPTPGALFWAYSDIFCANIEVWPIVAALKSAGHKLGLLSNVSPPHWKFVSDGRYSILPRCFDVCVLSYEIRCVKPNRDIYDYAAAQIGTPPSDIFFTDDVAKNVAGANAAGWDATLFTSAAQLATDLRCRGIPFNY
jgi:putative hydrolase of the HAD superfamily